MFVSTAAPEKNRISKDAHTRGPVFRLRGGEHQLTQQVNLCPSDQVLHDKLAVRIHQETLAVKGSYLYYVHMPGSALVGGDRAATTQQ